MALDWLKNKERDFDKERYQKKKEIDIERSNFSLHNLFFNLEFNITLDMANTDYEATLVVKPWVVMPYSTSLLLDDLR